MGTVENYLKGIEGPDRAALERVYSVARLTVPQSEEGTSYAMAALPYRGRGLVAAVQGRKFLSLYAYSGAVIAANLELLADFETTTGSVHFSATAPLPEAVLRRLIQTRRDEIDLKAR